MGRLSNNGRRGGSPTNAVSRRTIILNAAGALALSSGSTWSVRQAHGAQIDAPNRPTSKDADIVVWDEGQNGAGIPGPQYESVPHKLVLRGDWSGIKLVDGIAWGEGHEGKDVWKTGRATPHMYRLSFTGLQPIDIWGSCWYFTASLELGDSKSDHISAMFRYTRNRGGDGVFAAAFPFPTEVGSSMETG